MKLIIPPMSAMSVPERKGAYMSATAAVLVKRGSATINFAPLSFASIAHFIAIGWFSAGLFPIMKRTSAFLKSIM
jgi:hypothetical protein